MLSEFQLTLKVGMYQTDNKKAEIEIEKAESQKHIKSFNSSVSGLKYQNKRRKQN
jgi:hypothetical protein